MLLRPRRWRSVADAHRDAGRPIGTTHSTNLPRLPGRAVRPSRSRSSILPLCAQIAHSLISKGAHHLPGAFVLFVLGRGPIENSWLNRPKSAESSRFSSSTYTIIRGEMGILFEKPG